MLLLKWGLLLMTFAFVQYPVRAQSFEVIPYVFKGLEVNRSSARSLPVSQQISYGFTIHARRVRVYAYQISSKEEWETLLNSLGPLAKVTRFALVEEIAAFYPDHPFKQYHVQALRLIHSDEMICGEECQGWIEKGLFVAFDRYLGEYANLSPVEIALADNPWRLLPNRGRFEAVKFMASCECYEKDIHFHDFTGYSQGEGETQAKARHNAKVNCPLGRDIVTNRDRMFVRNCRTELIVPND